MENTNQTEAQKADANEIKDSGQIETTSINEIKELKRTNLINKIGAVILVVAVLSLSFILIFKGIDIYKDAALKQTSKTENVLLHHSAKSHKTDSATPRHHHPAKNTPIKVNEEISTYSYAPGILMCTGIIAFVALSLCGAFTMLSKVLTSENELNSRIFDLHKDIYKEREMWELAKEKKERELDYKHKELAYKIQEWEKFEKVKKEFEHNH